MSDHLERIVAPRNAEPACPAASLVSEAHGGSGCVCRITRDLIDSRRNGSTLARFCFNSAGYRQCPTWVREKREIEKTKTLRDTLTSDGDLASGHPEDRERDRALETAIEAQERDQWASSPS